jgi:hypothetical protein
MASWISLSGDVNLLRKQLHQAILSCHPTLPEMFLSGDTQEDFSLCVKKSDDLERYCIDSDWSCPLVAMCAKSLSLYFLKRFQNLLKWNTWVCDDCLLSLADCGSRLLTVNI